VCLSKAAHARRDWSRHEGNLTVLFWAFFATFSAAILLTLQFGHFLVTLRIRFVINYQLIRYQVRVVF